MAASQTTSVLVADDHPLLLKGLSDIVAAERDFKVVSTALDGSTALTLIREQRPDIAVLDLAMPELGGLELLKALAHEAPSVRVVILTAVISDKQVIEAIASGVWGIMLKESAPEALVHCLRGVAQGRKQLPDELVERAFSRQASSAHRGRSLNDMLTTRERELVALVCEGQSNNEIAEALGLSAGTVRIHLHNIYTKLNIRNRTALTALVLNEQIP
ncbi:response regulator transcription factor [Sphingomonas sp. LaA6.9]|uniref:response regulator n=1 Tax=Sphingomonas sp. LaA6.9 TaxID=2919914 RepID=UPI001F503741|nr:response regulator transcription factor [Sphingomonas sp. LaA6.9]MCJ8159139.1 response regulator transcription factor [Sphingomonas sp. LaA6.9]